MRYSRTDFSSYIVRNSMDFKAAVLERRYVHEVYEKIASEVGQGDYKAWPKVENFLRSLPVGSLVADIGCGHGKYLDINSGITVLGSDRCTNLVEIARQGERQVSICDNINLPYRSNSFDAVISIAVIHHFTTSSRRLKALQELARILRPGGKLMVYVWALEQKQRKFEGQDVLVPWHPTRLKRGDTRRNFFNGFSRMEDLRSSSPTLSSSEPSSDCTEILEQQQITQNNGLLNNHIRGIENNSTGNISKMLSCFSVESDDDDVYGVADDAKFQKQDTEESFFVRLGKSWKLPRLSSPSITRKTEEATLKEEEVIPTCYEKVREKKKGMNGIKSRLVRDSSLSGSSSDTDSDSSVDYKHTGITHDDVRGCDTPPPSPTLQRFYHVFQRGELSNLMKKGIPNIDVVQEYYDHANWAVIAAKRLTDEL